MLRKIIGNENMQTMKPKAYQNTRCPIFVLRLSLAYPANGVVSESVSWPMRKANPAAGVFTTVTR